MKHVFLVVYVIADPKRLRRVHQAVKGFGWPLQYSVFRCELTAAARVLLLERLTEEIHLREDRVMIVDLGPAGGREAAAITFLGVVREVPGDGPTVI